MAEQNRGEGEQTPESLESQKYAALLATLDEEDRIMKEIDQVFVTTTDRLEAEKFILENLAPKMDKAMKAMGEAFREWQRVTEEDMAAYRRDAAAHEEEMKK